MIAFWCTLALVSVNASYEYSKAALVRNIMTASHKEQGCVE